MGDALQRRDEPSGTKSPYVNTRQPRRYAGRLSADRLAHLSLIAHASPDGAGFSDRMRRLGAGASVTDVLAPMSPEECHVMLRTVIASADEDFRQWLNAMELRDKDVRLALFELDRVIAEDFSIAAQGMPVVTDGPRAALSFVVGMMRARPALYANQVARAVGRALVQASLRAAARCVLTSNAA